MMQDAVVRNLEIIGEAAKNLSEGLRSEHAEVAWTQIISMRNRLIHGYFSVDIEVVWEIVQIDLPILERQVAEMLA